MVRKTTRQRQDMSSTKSKTGNKSLITLFQKQEAQRGNKRMHASAPEIVFQPRWEEADEGSLEFLLEGNHSRQRPCYKSNEDCDNSLTDISHSSFTSHSMMQEENPKRTQKRRDRIEQMRTDRELVAQLELRNLALEQATRNQKKLPFNVNQSLNTFLTKSRRRGPSAAGGSITSKSTVEHPSSPFVRPRVAPGKFMKSLNKISLPLMDDSSKIKSKHVGELQFLERDLPQEPVMKIPPLCIQEESFEVGRGQKGTKTIRRTGGYKKACRSPSPPRPPRSTSKQRSPKRTRSRARR